MLSAHPAPRTSSRASPLPGSAPPLSRRRLARPAVGDAGGERRRPQPLSPPRKGAGLAGRPRALAGPIRAGGRAPGAWDSRGVRRECRLFPATLLRQLGLRAQVFPASYAPRPQGNCPRVACSSLGGGEEVRGWGSQGGCFLLGWLGCPSFLGCPRGARSWVPRGALAQLSGGWGGAEWGSREQSSTGPRAGWAPAPGTLWVALCHCGCRGCGPGLSSPPGCGHQMSRSGPSRGPGWLHLVGWGSETAVGGGERGAEERGRGQGALPRPQARPREKFRLSTYFSVPSWLWACLLL